MMEALVTSQHKRLKFEHIYTKYIDIMAAATRRQSDAEITHMFKNRNQDTLWTW